MKISSLLQIAVYLTVSIPAAFAQANVSARYRFVTVDYPGASVTYPLGINIKNEVAGYYFDSSGIPHGFLYKAGKFSIVEYPGAVLTVAAGINDRGDVSGTYTDFHGFQHGYLMKVPEGCDDRPGRACQPSYESIDYPGAAQTTIPFELGPGLGTAAANLNNRDEVVGMYAAGVYSNGFTFSPREGYRPVDNPTADHGPANGTRLFSVNNLGASVGDYLAATGIDYGFVLDCGHYSPIFVPNSDKGGFGTQVNGINDFGMVVGVFSDPKGGFHGLLWIAGQPFILDFPTALYSETHAINNLGSITGSYASDPTAIHGFIAFPKLR